MTTTAPSTPTARNPLTLVLSLAIAGLALVAFVIGLFAPGASGIASSMLIVGLLALVGVVKPGSLTAWVLVAFDAAFLLASVGSWITFTDLPGTVSYWVSFVLLLLQVAATVVLALSEIGLVKLTPKTPAAFTDYTQQPGGGYGQQYGQPQGQGQQPNYAQPSPGYAAPAAAPGYGQPAGAGYGQPPAPGYGGQSQPQQPGHGQQQPAAPPSQPQQQPAAPSQPAPGQQPGGGYGTGSQYGQHGSQSTPPPQPPQPGQGGAPTSQPWQSPNT